VRRQEAAKSERLRSNRATKIRNRFSASSFCFFLFRVLGKGRQKEKPQTKAAGGPIWSAALYRRFCFSFWAMKNEKTKNTKKSGGKAPHSKWVFPTAELESFLFCLLSTTSEKRETKAAAYRRKR
jgi:hypothetical protein